MKLKKCNRVTVLQAKELKKLGFNEPTDLSFRDDKFCVITGGIARNWNKIDIIHWNGKKEKSPYVSLPLIDEAINFIRKKYNVIISDKIVPFVDPCSDKIVYSHRVKYCNLRHGWNARIVIGDTKLSSNIYASKRKAITMALRYIIKQKKQKTKIVKLT